ncbi:hypothetical protein HYALB_00010747 [Hymenoscyphus albidus]|uniref:Zn(2)-C6 fungal-type domain-containing protein n=1 Tax=Hymenoscyphus albidus TaxID=595503 RepID=A0A9N9LLB0_9HELO|nr:hypothetical protein HYALB_00010747 [Hymenoscyphus albidus]
METITIPSPTAFLSSPVIKPASEPPPPPKQRKQPPTKSATATSPKRKTGVVKPKQSKSRNGCVTCKAKRLKCDETKPECQQCHKRSVPCGGYKKDFKWRPFEETTFANKVAPSKPKTASIDLGKSQEKPLGQNAPIATASPKSDASSTLGAELEADVVMQDSFFHAAAPTPPNQSPLPDLNFDHHPFFDMSTPPYMRELPRPRFEADSITKSLSSLFEDSSNISPRASFSGQSPRLIDLLLPGSELNARPGSLSIPPLSMSTPALTMSPMESHCLPPLEISNDGIMDDDVEEVIRESQTSDVERWIAGSPIYFETGSSPPYFLRAASPAFRRGEDSFSKIYRQPEFQAGSPEMLMLRFDKQTCGILSVKDSASENPWRSLIWPLARESPALYHAIASMTAFHISKERAGLRVEGMEHMRRSIRSLASGIENMRTDTALATTLVLAFSESWDQHVSTGIEHLRGAKILVYQALESHRKKNLTGDDLSRLRFLCNTWVYMDVIARLTSIDNESSEFEHAIPLNMHPSINNIEVDPLMGCASTLFPLIGQVANLCRKVRMVESNSIQIIEQATTLKKSIEEWYLPPGSAFESPEDPTSEIQHALQTAEAYRWATLLYLHQAVPEIPSYTSAFLAQKVLKLLATVPLSSRLVIVQIYPLLAAGCEAYDNEDRQWVEDRWRNMAARMWIGNVDRCWDVMLDVWQRRDADEIAKAEKENRRRPTHGGMIHSESNKRLFEEEMAMDDMFAFESMLGSNNSSQNGGISPAKKQRHNSASGVSAAGNKRPDQVTVTEDMDPELTVRGRMHWVGVMKERNWEILLG